MILGSGLPDILSRSIQEDITKCSHILYRELPCIFDIYPGSGHLLGKLIQKFRRLTEIPLTGIKVMTELTRGIIIDTGLHLDIGTTALIEHYASVSTLKIYLESSGSDLIHIIVIKCCLCLISPGDLGRTDDIAVSILDIRSTVNILVYSNFIRLKTGSAARAASVYNILTADLISTAGAAKISYIHLYISPLVNSFKIISRYSLLT